MSKQNNIRWRRSDYSRLSHLIRKTNKKIFEITVKRPDIADYQPAMLDYQELKNMITTRREFNLIMNKYNRYLRDGVEEITKSDRGAVASKWAVHEFEIMQRAENIRRRNERKKIGEEQVTIAGVEQASKRSQMGSVWENSFKESKKKYKNMGAKDWEQAFKSFEQKMFNSNKEKMRVNMVRNYVKGLIAEGYPDELISMMNHIDTNTFLRVFSLDEIAYIDFIYDPMDLKAKADLLLDLWSQYVNEEVDNGIDYNNIRDEVMNEYANGERIKGKGRLYYKSRKRKRK